MAGLLPLSLFDNPDEKQVHPVVNLAETQARIMNVLKGMGVEARFLSAVSGPVLARYDVELPAGTETAKITIHSRDFAKVLDVNNVRIIDHIDGTDQMAFEVPHVVRERIYLSDFLKADFFTVDGDNPTLPIGKDMNGKLVVSRLSALKHLLIGSQSSGENNSALHSILLSLLHQSTPEQLRLVLIDAQQSTFSVYQDIPHLLTPVSTDIKRGMQALRWGISEMERRAKLFENAGVAEFNKYNQQVVDGKMAGKTLPRIVIAIDEFALILRSLKREAEVMMARFAIRGHQLGIHLMIATQWISFDTVTGLLRADFPTRIAFKAKSMTDSRRIAGENGAEALLGQGDMLYLAEIAPAAQRVHGVNISKDELARIGDYLRAQGKPAYDSSVLAAGN